MKSFSAIAIIEFRDIPVGIHAADAMIKKSPIALLKTGIISEGRYLVMIGGSTASVDESFQEGLFWGRDSVVDSVMLPDVHPQVHDAVLGKHHPDRGGSMAILETKTVSCNVRAAELALKGTPIDLMSLRFADSWLAGKGVSIYRGELHDIEAAVDIVTVHLEGLNHPVLSRIIPAPHESLTEEISSSAMYQESRLLELEGEAG
jgi:microcompartment protein CcmL/EutN